MAFITLPASGSKIHGTFANGDEFVERMQLVRSDDLSPITADASGLRVALGAALPAGTNNIGDVDVLSLPALPAGANAIGKLAANSGVDIGDVTLTAGSANVGTIGIHDGTTLAGVSTAGTKKGLYVAHVDSAGNQVDLLPMVIAAPAITVDTVAYAVGDVLFVATAFAGAVSASGGKGSLYRLTLVDKDNEGPTLDLYVCSATISLTRNVAYASAVADGDALKIIERLTIPAAGWEAHGNFKRYTLGTGDGLPLAYHCSAGTDLHIFGVTQTAITYTGANDLVIEAQMQPD